MILFTSPKMERFNEAVKWLGFTQYYMSIWEHDEITMFWALQYIQRLAKQADTPFLHITIW